MKLIKQIFPEPSYATLSSKDIGEIVRFCKETEELLTLINDEYRYAVSSLLEGNISEAYNYIKFIEKHKEQLKSMYKYCPEIIKSWMDIRVLKGLDKLVKMASRNIHDILDSDDLKDMDIKIQKMIKELNENVKDLCVYLTKLMV